VLARDIEHRERTGDIGSMTRRLRRLGGSLYRAMRRLHYVWSTEPDNHPDVLAESALADAAARSRGPVTLAFAYNVPPEKIGAYLADPRVAAVVTKDGQHESYLPDALRNDARVGSYWSPGAWSLPTGSHPIYLIGQWRLITRPMLRQAVREDVRVLRARCAWSWIDVPLPAAHPTKAMLALWASGNRKIARRLAIATYRTRRRMARVLSRLGPLPARVAVSLQGEMRLAGWGYERVFRHVLRSPLPADGRVYQPVKRRIVLVCGNLAPGGAERQVAYTVAGLAARPVESVQLLCDHLSPGHRSRYDFYLPYVQAAGGKARQIRTEVNPGDTHGLPPRLYEVASALPGGLVADIANLYWEFLKLRPEVVHAWLDWSNVRAGIAAALAGVPQVLVSGRNLNPSHFALYDSYMDPAYKALVELPNVVFLNNSQAGANDYADWLGIPRERIRVIRNGIDFAARSRSGASEAAAMRMTFGIPADAFLVGGVFRLSPEKRPLLWIEAAAVAAMHLPNAHFILFGQGDLKAAIESKAAELGIADRVVLAGVTNDVLSAISMMDVFLLTSSGEGLPNVVLEAQWVGTPVVATNAGGTPEAVLEGCTGWIVDDASPQAIADRIRMLHADATLQSRARLQGPEFVRARFGVTRMIDETWAAYGYGENPNR
jgi:glycosyltransferase involved in cell wall biosynthesis